MTVRARCRHPMGRTLLGHLRAGDLGFDGAFSAHGQK
jgi:hypothetical protein